MTSLHVLLFFLRRWRVWFWDNCKRVSWKREQEFLGAETGSAWGDVKNNTGDKTLTWGLRPRPVTQRWRSTERPCVWDAGRCKYRQDRYSPARLIHSPARLCATVNEQTAPHSLDQCRASWGSERGHQAPRGCGVLSRTQLSPEGDPRTGRMGRESWPRRWWRRLWKQHREEGAGVTRGPLENWDNPWVWPAHPGTSGVGMLSGYQVYSNRMEKSPPPPATGCDFL